MSSIQIIPFHFTNQAILQNLAKTLGNEFQQPVTINTTRFNFSYAYDSSRKQYHSTQLLNGLLNYFIGYQGKILGITELDLFIPILTFVFGEAQLNGKAAVVSSFRLEPQFYGLPKDDDLLMERIIKESVHELGHTFGLKHCRAYDCVMSSSTSAEEIEIKSLYFCNDCKSEINL